MSAANASTATGTTATAKPGVPGAGRFAPSPSGALHLGSLATATASYLDARHRGSRWLLRIEDLDTARTVPGAADTIVRDLDRLGFCWDGPVTYQSQRLTLYRQALADLAARGLTYLCTCSRRDLGAADDAGGYPGTCRLGPRKAGPAAIRFRFDLSPAAPFEDRLQGMFASGSGNSGDPVVQRRDGIHAYQLAVVVDDAEQGVSDVVRGADLLSSTHWQRALQWALGLPQPRYMHLPLVCEPDGSKLSKSTRAIAPQTDTASTLVWRALTLLRQGPPAEAIREPLPQLWAWAIAHWRPEALHGVVTLPAD